MPGAVGPGWTDSGLEKQSGPLSACTQASVGRHVYAGGRLFPRDFGEGNRADGPELCRGLPPSWIPCPALPSGMSAESTKRSASSLTIPTAWRRDSSCFENWSRKRRRLYAFNQTDNDKLVQRPSRRGGPLFLFISCIREIITFRDIENGSMPRSNPPKYFIYIIFTNISLNMSVTLSKLLFRSQTRGLRLLI